ARGRRGEAPRHVAITEDLDPACVHHVLRLGELAIAAALDREIDDHRARTHRGNHVFRDQPRCLPAGDQRRRDHDVLFLNVLGDEGGLLGLIVLRHFLGIAARGFGLLELLILDRNALGAEALYLLLRRRPHVGGPDDRTQPPPPPPPPPA